MYFVIEAMAQIGHKDQAIVALYLCWGKIIELGGTTLGNLFSFME